MIINLLTISLSLIQLIGLVGLGYYYLLLIASLPKRQTTHSPPPHNKSFAVVIPAHNEGSVLSKTLKALKKQNYPAHLFDIYIVADHCTDNTAHIARANGVICFERDDKPQGRKAYALQWLFKRIFSRSTNYQAFVILDADSRVAPDFLGAMNAALNRNSLVLQGKHIIANPQNNYFSSLAAVDMRLNNLLRNQAKQNLGLSCRLMGDAMCFTVDIIRRYGWPADSLTEDREYSLFLLYKGIRIKYVPTAVSCGEAAPGWKAASAQRLRWYRGVNLMQKKFVVKLISLGLRQHSWSALDQALEFMLPPLSILAILPIITAVFQWFRPSPELLLPLPMSLMMIISWLVFPVLGLWIDNAPLRSYRALLLSPLYIIWRLWLSVQTRISGKKIKWIRTERSGETGTRSPRL